MGDRANILVKDGENKVYLYSHSSGSRLPEILKNALAKNERWDDAPYLTRIIFCEMIKSEQGAMDRTTGFGISSTVGDGDDRILTVDVGKQTITLNGNDFSYEEFTNLPESEVRYK